MSLFETALTTNDGFLPGLLLGSLLLRPYVYAFLLCFLFFSIYQIGFRLTRYFFIGAFSVAYLSEYASTHIGIPFGDYYYLEATRTRELWILNVPFFDTLSFVFLSYFSWVMGGVALRALKPIECKTQQEAMLHRLAPFAGGFFMMLLDVVIDPVALQGDRWFLGQIYGYAKEGFYFGVTAANFFGWLLVGTLIIALGSFFAKRQRVRFRSSPRHLWGSFGVYVGVFAFNLAVTIWIQDYRLAAASAVVIFFTIGSLILALRRNDANSNLRRDRDGASSMQKSHWSGEKQESSF